MKRFAVVTSDRMLYQKLRIALLCEGRCDLLDYLPRDASYTRVFVDMRHGEDFSIEGGNYVVILPRESAIIGNLGYPFTHDELLAAAEGDAQNGARLLLDYEMGAAILHGEVIPLTDVEYRLLSKIYDGRGEFVSREELILAVWGEGTGGGVLSVYIHYLREKLEVHGEKIIISSRGSGYKIQEEYIGGVPLCLN